MNIRVDAIIQCNVHNIGCIERVEQRERRTRAWREVKCSQVKSDKEEQGAHSPTISVLACIAPHSVTTGSDQHRADLTVAFTIFYI